MCFFKNKNLSKQYRNKESGFSLLELGIVLGIVGLLVAGSISVFSEQKTHAQWQESDLKLQLVKKSLINYVALNKFLLCPDDSGDGFEDRKSDGTCRVNEGKVPFLNLELPEAAVQDSWGNRFGYAINRDAVNLVNMTDCPNDTACFFNNQIPPAFDLTTLPVMGNVGNNNLRVCTVNNCTAATPDTNIDGDNLVAVLIAFNQNGGVTSTSSLDAAEAENRDGDTFFVRADYSEAPYFDDLIQTLSANELKKRFDLEVMADEVANTNPGNPIVVVPGAVPIAGGSGDNDRFSDNIGVNIATETFEFGSEYAGQTVTLTFDAKIEGGWEDANEETGDRNKNGKLETQDRFMVGLNGGDVSDLHGQLVNLEEGVARFDNHQVTESFYYDADLDSDNTWYEYLSFDVELDSDGNLKVDLAVFSTHVSEKVTVTNMNTVLYLAPPSVPNFPGVQEIDAIPQTEGLE